MCGYAAVAKSFVCVFSSWTPPGRGALPPQELRRVHAAFFPPLTLRFERNRPGAPGSRSRRLRTAAVFGSICSGPLIRQNLGELFGAWRRQTCGRQIFSRAKRSSRADCPLGGRSGAYKENRAGSPDFSPNRPCRGGLFYFMSQLRHAPFRQKAMMSSKKATRAAPRSGRREGRAPQRLSGGQRDQHHRRGQMHGLRHMLQDMRSGRVPHRHEPEHSFALHGGLSRRERTSGPTTPSCSRENFLRRHRS